MKRTSEYVVANRMVEVEAEDIAYTKGYYY